MAGGQTLFALAPRAGQRNVKAAVKALLGIVTSAPFNQGHDKDGHEAGSEENRIDTDQSGGKFLANRVINYVFQRLIIDDGPKDEDCWNRERGDDAASNPLRPVAVQANDQNQPRAC